MPFDAFRYLYKFVINSFWDDAFRCLTVLDTLLFSIPWFFSVLSQDWDKRLGSQSFQYFEFLRCITVFSIPPMGRPEILKVSQRAVGTFGNSGWFQILNWVSLRYRSFMKRAGDQAVQLPDNPTIRTLDHPIGIELQILLSQLGWVNWKMIESSRIEPGC